MTYVGDHSPKERLECVELSKICNATPPKPGRKFHFNLLVEYEPAANALRTWRLQSNEPMLRYSNTLPSISFADMLARYSNPLLLVIRR